ncbi:AAA family ATPase [Moritella viscosa]|uniref:AAA family ATPase n=1 Tax=Moritella viscosa TaxID=80854 RepID=UPI00091B16AD|nr:AAA family ATPase [Moritella viscosa]SHN99496.1 Putative excinuclease ATPase subunit [Moritella viscosa]SHO00771.1 Putative excinuclease ATPase subunit [Moritella viscosa]SHO01999.1 Putative excinuclease ATPase subunit [Moritella viscosa]
MNNYIKRVRASGLFYQDTELVVDFTELTNCIYGVNGTGKTVLINLIVNALRVNVYELLESPFFSLTLLSTEKGKKQPENFITVKKHDGDIVYIFHTDIDVTLENPWRSNKANLLKKIKKGVHYRVEKQERNHWIKKTTCDGLTENEIVNINPRIISNAISKHISLTYVPLLRHSYTSATSEHLNYKDEYNYSAIDPNVAVLKDLENEFSRRFAAAQVEVSAILENLSSKFFEKLLLSQDFNLGPSNHLAKIQKISASNVVDYDQDKVTEVASIVTELKLQISEGKIYKHYDLWRDMQQKLIDSNRILMYENGKGNTEEHDAYREAYFNLLAYIPIYEKFESAIDEVKHAYYKKQLLLSPFEKFENEVNHFLSNHKHFEFDNSGRFNFRNNGRPFNFSILSSGEKHLIAILGRVCVSSFNGTSTFIADEPELSLHLEWQRKILPAVHRLSPNTQIIVATHSPAVIASDSHLIDIEECYKNG